MVRRWRRRGWATLVAAVLVGGAGPGVADAVAPDHGPTSGGTTVSGELPDGVTFTSVSAGSYHSLAIGSDGVTYAWGFGAYGQLGNGGTGNSAVPVAVHAPDGVTFTSVSAGGIHSVAIGSDGATYAWGDGQYGQLGNGGTVSSTEPVRVTMPDDVTATSIAAGWTHSLAIGSDGVTYAWGNGTFGQLGTGGTGHALEPVAVSVPEGVTFTAVAGGYFFSLAIGLDGVAYAWGNGGNGQLGNGSTTGARVPVAVSAPDGVTFTAISAGGAHSVAVGSDRRVYAWGGGARGELGDGAATSSPVPVAVSAVEGVTFTAVSAGDTHSVAIGSDGLTYAWGSGAYGQLGTGDTGNALEPVAVEAPDGVTFTAVGAGYGHSVAAGSDGVGYAWGDGASGQLGNGDTGDAMVPVPVAMTPVLESVTFDGAPGTGLAQDGRTWTVTTPSHACGPVEVEVTWTQLGVTRTARTTDGYTYGSAPVVTAGPTAAGPAEDGTVTLTAAAEGDDAPTVQWQQSPAGTGDWTDIPGATNTTFTARAEAANDYRAAFTNCLGTVTTAAVSVAGDPAPPALAPVAPVADVRGVEDAGAEDSGAGRLAQTGAGAVAVLVAAVLLVGCGVALVARTRLRRS